MLKSFGPQALRLRRVIRPVAKSAEANRRGLPECPSPDLRIPPRPRPFSLRRRMTFVRYVHFASRSKRDDSWDPSHRGDGFTSSFLLALFPVLVRALFLSSLLRPIVFHSPQSWPSISLLPHRKGRHPVSFLSGGRREFSL
jgi:hypothetical protein